MALNSQDVNLNSRKKTSYDDAELERIHIKDGLFLVPVGEWIHNTRIVEEFLRWRNQNRDAFFYDSPVREEDYVQHILRPFLHLETKILYLITGNDTPIGHIGISVVSRHEYELTQVLKGDSGYPFLMEEAIRALMIHLSQGVEPLRVVLHARKKNTRAITLYQKCGFKEFPRKSSCRIHIDCTYMFKD